MKKENDFGAEWWKEKMSRRDANKNIVKIGGLSLLLASAGIVSSCDEDIEESAADALEIQKNEGWNVGSENKPLSYSLNPISETSLKNPNWKSYCESSKLLSVFKPVQSAYQPFFIPTLIQSLSQKTLKERMIPRTSPSCEIAYHKGKSFLDILDKIDMPETLMFIVDLPGAESVAFAAGLSSEVEPVITFDNWPHPTGVVPAHNVLSSMVYYAEEFEINAKSRKNPAPSVFVLDWNRLNDYVDDDTKFDNRYMAKLPTVEKLKELKIAKILYFTNNQTKERDDINEDFSVYKDNKIDVSMVNLNDFKKESSDTNQTNKSGTTNVNHYHYGGHSSMLPYFLLWYAMTPRATYIMPTAGRMGNPTINRPNYSPVRRPTIFSSRNTGGSTKGFGKSKPTSFGRVSRRTGSSFGGSRSRSGRSSRRSGSFGRGGFFGG